MKILDLSKRISFEDVESFNYNADLNQLYKPTSVYDVESFDLVYIRNQLEESKFFPLIIDEAFSLLSVGQYLVFEYCANDIFNPDAAEKTLWWLFKKRYEILCHSEAEDYLKSFEELTNSIDKYSRDPLLNSDSLKKFKREAIYRLVVKKKLKCSVFPECKDWSFGIVTNGKNDDGVNRAIQSIKNLNIPNFEIIVCGSWLNSYHSDCIHLDFNERNNLGWITKKKNIIVEKAKYNNVCIIHDRILFDKNWYLGFEKWGYNFKFLTVPQLENGYNNRFGDWVCNLGYMRQNRRKLYPIKNGYMRYEDWSPDIPAAAAVYIVKREIGLMFPFDETKYWDEAEDLDLSSILTSNGILLRLNPYSVTYTTRKTVFDTKFYFEFDPIKTGKLSGVNIFLKGALATLAILGIDRDTKIFKLLLKRYKKYTDLRKHNGKF